mgnify:CR=1 FL=1
MAGTIPPETHITPTQLHVSMESGLDGRNNVACPEGQSAPERLVSMESGLDGRNNMATHRWPARVWRVSMESGLDGRNNRTAGFVNERMSSVSMESGLDGRNNEVGELPIHR